MGSGGGCGWRLPLQVRAACCLGSGQKQRGGPARWFLALAVAVLLGIVGLLVHAVRSLGWLQLVVVCSCCGCRCVLVWACVCMGVLAMGDSVFVHCAWSGRVRLAFGYRGHTLGADVLAALIATARCSGPCSGSACVVFCLRGVVIASVGHACVVVCCGVVANSKLRAVLFGVLMRLQHVRQVVGDQGGVLRVQFMYWHRSRAVSGGHMCCFCVCARWCLLETAPMMGGVRRRCVCSCV